MKVSRRTWSLGVPLQVPRSVSGQVRDSSGTLVTQPHRLKALGGVRTRRLPTVPPTMAASVETGRWPWPSILSEYLLQDTCGVTECNPQTGIEGKNKQQEKEVMFKEKNPIWMLSNLLLLLIFLPHGAQLASTLHFLSQLKSKGWNLWVSLVLWGLPEVLGLISRNVLLCFYTQILLSAPLLCHVDKVMGGK